MPNLNQNKSKPSLSKEELIEWAKNSPLINKGIWGKASVEALKKATK